MDGVKIMRPSLDDIEKNTVLRGVLAMPIRNCSPPSGTSVDKSR
jgi:hypothetical protein